MKHELRTLTVALIMFGSAASAMSTQDVDKAREVGIQTLETMDESAAISFLSDPSSGVYEMEVSGLHIWTMNRQGIIGFDVSNQTAGGMDLSQFPTPAGPMFHDWVWEFASNAEGGGGLIDFPHPTTNEVATSYQSCRISPSDSEMVVCAGAWGDW